MTPSLQKRLLLFVFLVLSANLLHCSVGSYISLSASSDKLEPRPRIVAQRGHFGALESADFSKDGSLVVTGGVEDNTAILWDAATGTELRRFEGHLRGLRHVALRADDEELLTAGNDGAVKQWSLKTGRSTHSFSVGEEPVANIIYSSDGTKVLTVSQDSAICSWPIPQRLLSTHTCYAGLGALQGASFSASADRLLVIYQQAGGQHPFYDDNIADVRDPNTGEVITKLTRVPTRLTSNPAVISPDGSLAAILAEFDESLVYELPSGRVLWSFHGDPASDQTAAFDPTNQVLLRITEQMESSSTHSTDSRVYTSVFRTVGRLYDARTGTTIGAPFELGNMVMTNMQVTSETGILAVQGVVFRADGRAALVLTASADAWLISIPGGKVLRRFKSAHPPIAAVAVGPESTSLAIASPPAEVEIWDLSRGGVSETLPMSKDPTVPNTAAQVSWAAAIRGVDPGPAGLYFSKDGDDLTLDSQAFVLQWNAATSKIAKVIPRQLHAGFLRAIQPDALVGLIERPTEQESTLGWIHTFHFWDLGKEQDIGGTKYLHDHSHFFGQVLILAHFNSAADSVFGVNDWRMVRIDEDQGLPRCTTDEQPTDLTTLTLSPDERWVVTGDAKGLIRLWDATSCALIRSFTAGDQSINSLSFSRDSDQIIAGTGSGTARTWRLSNSFTQKFVGHDGDVTAADFLLEGRLAVTAGVDGTVRVWQTQDGRELLTMLGGKANWVVVSPEGFFDAADLRNLGSFHWVFQDDPFYLLPADAYMRDYYDPGLLQKVLQGEDLRIRPQPSLSTLNRARPVVEDIRIRPGTSPGMVNAIVAVSAGTYRRTVTGAYDLRLYRDGQLVRRLPAPEVSPNHVLTRDEWRSQSVVAESGSVRTVVMENIKIPHGSQDVAFSAYAFNADRVRGDVKTVVSAAAPGMFRRKAYILSVGISNYGNPEWDLRFAAGDASKFGEALRVSMVAAGYETEVETVVSDDRTNGADKNGIREAIDRLSRKSTPDDIVLLYFSGHGYRNQTGSFFMLPSDCHPNLFDWPYPSEKAAGTFISSEELAIWLDSVDAQEIVMVIDACQSGASVGPEFRPAPLGDPGFGQLAYDKRMRILAASQPGQAAAEAAGEVCGGVLTYALVHDGIRAGKAQRSDGSISLRSLLAYPVTRVPALLGEIAAGRVDDYGIPNDATCRTGGRPKGNGAGSLQVPKLFDFADGEGPEWRLPEHR